MLSYRYGEKKLHFYNDDDHVSTVLNHNTHLRFYSHNSLKQVYIIRDVAPLGYIIMTRRKPATGKERNHKQLKSYKKAYIAHKYFIDALMYYTVDNGRRPA